MEALEPSVLFNGNLTAPSLGCFLVGDFSLLLLIYCSFFFLGQFRTSVGSYAWFFVSRFNHSSPSIFILSLMLIDVPRVFRSVWFVQNSFSSVGSTVRFCLPFPKMDASGDIVGQV